MKNFSVPTFCRAAAACLLLASAGCVHVEVFHPDVEGTYHLGPDRPFWSYEGPVTHVELPQPVQPAAQETPTWCWAASCQMLLASQGVTMSQSEIVRRAYGDARSAGGKSPLIVQVLSGKFTNPEGKSVALQAHRADGFPKNGLELVGSIEEGMPFVVDIGYYKDGKVRPGEAYAAHSLLVYGVTYQREGNNVRVLSLDVIDPSYAMIKLNEPGYSAHQKMDAKNFPSIQGTIGVYRK